MTRFNIIGTGFLDMADTAGLGFKTQNHFFRFSDISLGRSTEFNVPATDRNRQMLGFAEDPIEWGGMLRTVHPAQLVYDGGVKTGTLSVTSYDGNAFKCVFSIGNAEWLEALQKRKLSDCPTSWTTGTPWATTEPIVDADNADPTQGVQLLRYENGVSWANWAPIPSVNIKAYIKDILTQMVIPYDINALSDKYWMVAGSMKGGTTDSVTFDSTAADNLTISQSQGYFSRVDIVIEWASGEFFFLYGGGSLNAKGIQANQDVTITFPTSMPDPCFLVKWSSKLAQCEVIAGNGTTPYAAAVPNIEGYTASIKKGDILFFATKRLQPGAYGGTNDYIGWKDTLHPYTFNVEVVRDTDLSIGETWYMACNHPDMTVFEFLKSVALATGLELVVDGETGVKMQAGDYGPTYAKAADKVISIDHVARLVECWGNGTRLGCVDFDSEDYVTQPMKAEYEVQNAQPQDTKTTTAKFSEGDVGTNGVLIKDTEVQNGVNKYVGKKWTIAYADSGSTYLQRIPQPDFVGYLDISAESTAVKMKLSAPLADFFDLVPETTLLWRGNAFVWTDASWSDGVLTLSLQKVSQPPTLPYDAEVEYLESDGDQFIDTGIVPDDSTGMKAICEYVASGMDVAGLMESTNGFIVGASNVASYAYWGGYKNGIAFNKGTILLNYSNSRNFHVDEDGGTTYDYALGTLPFTPTLHILLFGFNNNGVADGKPTRLYAFQVTHGSALIMDMIPVRVGSVGYMYDRVSRQLFGNVGTGDFIVGPDV